MCFYLLVSDDDNEIEILLMEIIVIMGALEMYLAIKIRKTFFKRFHG